MSNGPTLLRVGVILLASALAVPSCSNDTDADGAPDDPAVTIEAYVEAYNAGDIDGVMALFSDESVVIGSPLDPHPNGESRGLAQIQELHSVDMGSAARENAYTISNVEVSGNTMRWDHVWVNDAGNSFCGTGNSAVVEGGRIVSWTFAPDPSLCPSNG